MLKNTSKTYGWVAIFFHWISAIAIFGMFGLGLYMVDLTYYDDLYKAAPYVHKSIGVLLSIFVVARLLWKWLSPRVLPLSSHKPWEVSLAQVVHYLLYGLIAVAVVSGFLISTADGSGVDVFGWFEVPSIINEIDNLEDVAGEVHEMATWSIMFLIGLHLIGALKHHCIDKDATLRRMLSSDK